MRYFLLFCLSFRPIDSHFVIYNKLKIRIMNESYNLSHLKELEA